MTILSPLQLNSTISNDLFRFSFASLLVLCVKLCSHVKDNLSYPFFCIFMIQDTESVQFSFKFDQKRFFFQWKRDS